MGISLTHSLVLGAIALVATFMLVPLVRKFAIAIDAVDYPSERRINKRAVPRLGGLAMFGGMSVAIIAEILFIVFSSDTSLSSAIRGIGINYVVLGLGIAIVCAVGVLDDIYRLSPGLKLLGQVIAAIVIAFSGVQLSAIGNPVGPGFINFGWLSYPITVIYLIVFANIINLIDGLDGLAAGIVAIAALALFIIAFGKGRVEATLLSVILLGASLAFLKFNRFPASIFMGDSGSLMLGMILGVISLTGVMRSPTVIVLIVPIVIAAVPLIDTAAAVFRRIRKRQPIQNADTEHLHHRLVMRGFSMRKSVNLIYLWTFILAIGGILISNTRGITVFIIFFVLALVSLFFLWRTGLFEPVLKHHYHPRPEIDEFVQEVEKIEASDS